MLRTADTSALDDDWQKAPTSTCWHPFVSTTFLLRLMKRKSGVILHISSIQHRLPLYDATLALCCGERCSEYLQ